MAHFNRKKCKVIIGCFKNNIKKTSKTFDKNQYAYIINKKYGFKFSLIKKITQ